MKVVFEAKTQASRGFTIVELIIVVTVIAILAAVTVISYGSWRTSVNTKAVKSDLIAAAATMENARTTTNSYPSALPSDFSPSTNVAISVASASSKAYCLNGVYAPTPSIQYYTDESIGSGDPKSGTCASRTVSNIPGVISNVTSSNATTTQLQVSWSLASPNYATSYEVQCAQDAAFIRQSITATASGAATTSTIVNGAQPGTSYYCRVRAVNANGKSEWTRGQMSNTVALACADTGQYGTYPNCYNYDSLAVGTSMSGYWTTPPDGYLLEDGSAVSRTTYADLFAVIGTTYGAGDGFSTFELPDSRGRATVALSSADTEFNTVGKLYGEKSHVITLNELPNHTHGQFVTANSGGSAVRNDWASDGGSLPYSQGINTSTVGGGGSYSVLQPSIVKRYAIKYRLPTGSTSTLPAGTSMQGYWGATPSSYLEEGGQAVSRTSNAALFTALGTTYGAGDGSTTFTVPNSRGRVGVGLNAGDSNFGTMGQTSGEKQHTLTIAEMAPHTHMMYITAGTGGSIIRNDYKSDAAGGTYDQGQQTGDAGGGQPHNVIQPSITKRSAVKSSASSGTQSDEGVQPGTSVEGWWSSVPAGFLLEDGSAVSRTTYANLFAVIGTTYGSGNGSTTFNLPDSRGRVGVNLSPSDSEFDAMGEKVGSKTHIMTIGEMPSHSHAQHVTANSGCCAIRRDYTSDGNGAVYTQNIGTASAGGGAAFNVIQPSITKRVVIKY